MWLRKHGFIFTEEHGPASADFVVAARDAPLTADLPAGIYEGPFSRALLDRLNLAARNVEAETVAIYPDDTTLGAGEPACFAGLAYGRDVLRRIPAQGRERSDPYIWHPKDPRLAAGLVPLQLFQTAPGWRVLAYARADGSGDKQPVIVSNGKFVLLGLPLFAMVGRKHWMPSIEHGYYAFEHNPFMVEAEIWLARLIRNAVLEAGATCMMLDPWPNGCRASLSIRLDFDRDISTDDFNALLGFFDDYQLKASCGFLVRLAPVDKLAELVSRGHEIVLHTEAADCDELLHEVRTFRDQGWPVTGVTAHGGIGSAGHLGQLYFDWAAEAGLRHADILSRHTHAPHPMVAVRDGRIETGPLFLPPTHHSLDLGMRPDAHRLGELLNILPTRLDAGDHVTIMNHPDIHRAELRELVSALRLDNVWSETHSRVTEWIAAVRYGWSWGSEGGLRFAAPLPCEVILRSIGHGDEHEEVYAPA